LSAPAIRTVNLTKRYGALTAVKGMCLEVQSGEILGFLGPNGAGKTTAINLMCGLLKPDGGQVFIHGKPVNRGDTEVRAGVGVCPQNIVLWNRLTCLEQLEFVGVMYGVPRHTARQRGEKLLDVLGLSEKSDRLAATLSGGMQRRLNLLLALVHEPNILVLDEPEAGLDAQSRVMVREYIRDWARQGQRTVVLTTHNMDEAERVAQRVAILDHGELLVVDTPAALKKSLGEGDVLEVELNGGGQMGVEWICAHLSEIAPTAQMLGHTLVVRVAGAVHLLPAILERLAQIGIQPGEVRLRQNTLEDVFIAMTGRRLRE
jgi:ABC-2 type transport system ATP-binding protein